MAQFYPARSNIQNERVYRIRLLGVNGADPTKQEGEGVTVTRTSEGLYKITWAVNPFQFIGFQANFGSLTMDDLVDYTCVRGVYNSTAFTLAFSVYKQNGTVEDLVANQYLDINVVFSESGY
jgi:hypothetical protein